MQGGPPDPGGLPTALLAALRDATDLGLEVHTSWSPLPGRIDADATRAIAMAVREALNNVHRHSGTGTAWLSAGTESGRVVVRVVDRGVGFPPPAPPDGGIERSIVERMRVAGGTASVESGPSEGTWVELRWPA